jgi:hypothetical protein
VCIGKYESEKFPFPEWPVNWSCFLIIAFQLRFGIGHYDGPSVPGRSEIEGTQQLLAFAYDFNILKENIENTKRNTECFIIC